MTHDQLQRAVQVNAGFLVHRDPIRARINKGWNELIGVLDHEMHIQRHRNRFAQRAHDRRPNGDVWHEMTIHHVNMQQLRSSVDGGARVIAQTGEICRQYRRC